MRNFIKQMAVDAVSAVVIYWLGSLMEMSSVSYVAWVVLAVKVTAIGGIIVLVVNGMFYREYLGKIGRKVVSVVRRCKR